MAGERTLPGQGLYGFWNQGSTGWKTGMDDNLLRLSALVHLTASSRTVALPGSPAQGMVYIVPSSDGTNPNKVALYDNGAWAYLTPKTGTRAYVVDDAKFYYWTGSAWSREVADIPASIVPEAPIDGATYSRKDGAWITVAPTVAVPEAPINGTRYERQNGEWVAAAAGDPALGGDLSGTASAATVAKLRSVALSTTAPVTGQVLKFDGTAWAPATDLSGSGDPALGGDLSGTASAATVAKLQGRALADTAPTGGQAIVWDEAGSTWKPGTVTSGSSSSNVYDIPLYQPDKLSANMVLARIAVVRSFGLPVGLAGSQALAAVAATASTTITLQKGTTSIGSINFGAGQSTGTFTLGGGGTTVKVKFGAADVIAGWNSDPTTAASTHPSLLDSNGASTTIGLSSPAFALENGGVGSPVHADFPEVSQGQTDTLLLNTDTPVTMTWTGLKADRTYELRLYSTPGGVSTDFTVGGITKVLTSGTPKGVWTGLTPDGSLQIPVTIKRTTGSSFGGITYAALIEGPPGGYGATFAAGDILRVVAPATADATLSDISITLAGTRI